jgi:hypothetical protein
MKNADRQHAVRSSWRHHDLPITIPAQLVRRAGPSAARHAAGARHSPRNQGFELGRLPGHEYGPYRDVDDESVQASYQNGVLTVTLRRKQRINTRKIPIQ